MLLSFYYEIYLKHNVFTCLLRWIENKDES